MPQKEGILWKWTVHRTNSIGALFSRIQERKLEFPRATDCGTFLDEFACGPGPVVPFVLFLYPAKRKDRG